MRSKYLQARVGDVLVSMGRELRSRRPQGFTRIRVTPLVELELGFRSLPFTPQEREAFELGLPVLLAHAPVTVQGV